jgi:hypothetical protein
LVVSITLGVDEVGIVEDILKALDRIPGWKRIQELPSEIDKLNERLGAIEQKYGTKWPPDVCRYCGEQQSRLYHSYGIDRGFIRESWKCGACNREDDRAYKPSTR